MAVTLMARSPAPLSASDPGFWLLLFLLLVLCAGSDDNNQSICLKEFLSGPNETVHKEAQECGNTIPESSSPTLVVNGVLGESVTFPLKLPADQKVSTIIWSYDDAAFIVLNLAEGESPRDGRTIIDTRWTERLNFTESWSMRLSNLTAADEGLYKAQINSRIFSTYALRIFRRVGDLNITKHIELSANGTCEIQLACVVDDPDGSASLWWQASGGLSLSEPNLTISWDPRNSREQEYTCVAENPVSNVSSSVSTQSLCKGVFPWGTLHQHHVWLILGAAALAVAVVPLCALLWKRRRGSFPLSAEQAQRPAGSSPDIECSSVSPGSTVYVQVTHPHHEMEIPTPTKHESVTIYATVNQSLKRKPISPRPTALNNE